MNYETSIKILKSVNRFQIKLGLERIKSVLDILGNVQNQIRIIHVAGTNGKGSVCAMLANILSCSGYKTGLYTSPHLIEYTERIQIDGKQVSKYDFAKNITEICEIADRNKIELTEFEILTACAYKYFSEKKVDIAVIETGLGGRYDATNVCQNPICSIITSISQDHTDRLGNTIEKIAYEKAGIIKENSPVIVSKMNAGMDIVKECAKETGSKVILAENEAEIVYDGRKNYAFYNGKKYEFALMGLYQKQNLALVFKAVELLKEKGLKIEPETGLKTVKWHGRFEYIREKNMLIDGAHNPNGAVLLKNSLDYYFKREKRIFIYGTINTKDYKNIAKILFNKEDEIFYYEFKHKNAVSYEDYKRDVPFLNNIKPYTTEVLGREGIKILTGSLYMIGEFLKNT